MPYAKLTLRLDEATIQLGKKLSAKTGKSLSAMMAEKILEESSQRREVSLSEHLGTNRWGMQVPHVLRAGLADFRNSPSNPQQEEHMKMMMANYNNLG